MSQTIVVDGYNVIHAWPELAAVLRSENLEEARRRLIARLAEYRATSGNQVMVVFDARARARASPDREIIEGIEVRYGNVRESADHVIERLMYEASRRGRVLEMVLATDDRLQSDLVAGMGVPTISSRALRIEVERADRERGGEIRRRAEHRLGDVRIENRIPPDVRRRLDQIRRGEAGEEG
ncbi:MAG TPA: NYN domain-containing protein [Candidatus Binatia bacterium]|nr:NYN domain-containing protein [Candidatus Binatia bacterium]